VPPPAQLVHGGRHALVLLREARRQRLRLAQPLRQRCGAARPARALAVRQRCQDDVNSSTNRFS